MLFRTWWLLGDQVRIGFGFSDFFEEFEKTARAQHQQWERIASILKN